VRSRHLAPVVALLGIGLFAGDAPADTTTPTPVSVTVVGHGQIRLMVADGTSRPCDASSNHMLFDGHAKAGDKIKLTSATGSVCVDHTYGAMRESQWAGATIWSGSGFGLPSSRGLSGSVSTDEP
jgi:hypothetical protein